MISKALSLFDFFKPINTPFRFNCQNIIFPFNLAVACFEIPPVLSEEVDEIFTFVFLFAFHYVKYSLQTHVGEPP